MLTKNKETYVVVEDENLTDYLCPLDAVKAGSDAAGQVSDDCLEKDVAERYSGNIEIAAR
jgi:hypothetical protein